MFGDLVYLDGIGPECVKSASGNLYCLDIIDDATSMSFVYPVPSKDAQADTFRRFVAECKARDRAVRCIQIDNGELVSRKVDEFCVTAGIAVRRTAPHTSAHNGRVERLHRTLRDKSRTMRIASDIPRNRWDELYTTASYLYNCTPSTTVPDNKTPYQLYHGHPPPTSHLREIGSRAFVFIQTHNPKLNPRSLECVLIGYGSDSKTYRCYHRAPGCVISSYHVQFIESHESPPPLPLSPNIPVVPSSSSPTLPVFVPPLPTIITNPLPLPPHRFHPEVIIFWR